MGTSESGRPRRFALPALDDERTEESIEAFLEGPEVRRHRPVAKRWNRQGADSPGADATGADAAVAAPRRAPATDLRSIPGRLEWTTAIERESTRAARYRRPAAVAIVELLVDRPTPSNEAVVRSVVGPIARAIRGGTRATDLVARVATGRFHVLLPETDENGAGLYGERMSAACQSAIASVGAPLSVRVSVAAATPEHSLHEALAHALSSIEAA